MVTTGDVVRIAAMSDIHYGKATQGKLHDAFIRVNEHADVLLICGDLTDYGLPEEAKVLAKDLSAVRVPIVAVLGNHDYESGQEGEVTRILGDAGVRVLDGDSVEFHGIGFAGVRGFCGGFGRGALGAWGERVIKQFVHEAIEEALKLENALAKLRTDSKIALLHYSPIPQTVEGEPLEIYAFLGSSRLEEPLTRYPVNAVFHGHAHRGTVEGVTTTGIPVYNVCQTLLESRFPDRPPFWLMEVPRKAPETAPQPPRVERRQSGGRRAADRVEG